MGAVVIVLIGLLTVVLGRRLVLRRWVRGRIGTERAALTWAAALPSVLVLYSAAREQLHPLLLLIALGVGLAQFAVMRWALREFAGDLRAR